MRTFCVMTVKRHWLTRREGVVLNHQLEVSSRRQAQGSPVAEIAVVAAVDLVVVVAWTAWWHLSDLSGDGSLRELLAHTGRFLSWTFVPCWVLALGIVALAWRWTRRPKRWQPALVRALLTLLAPVAWGIGYCLYYDQLGYWPTAILVAEAAWIVTAQPLWAYLAFFRLGGRGSS